MPGKKKQKKINAQLLVFSDGSDNVLVLIEA
jgi:hypothetical protein